MRFGARRGRCVAVRRLCMLCRRRVTMLNVGARSLSGWRRVTMRRLDLRHRRGGWRVMMRRFDMLRRRRITMRNVGMGCRHRWRRFMMHRSGGRG